MIDDTIAAIATPLGEGGLSVLRISGKDALPIATKCFLGPKGKPVLLHLVPSHTVHYGFIEVDGRRIDEVLLTVLRAPRTFTREDVVEISCHGGLLPAQLTLEALLKCGARTAEPGEFTKRAFLNGRIDLAQAEAVADVIHSRTELALTAAQEQLAGNLSRRIGEVRDSLMITLAHIEAHIDFPDEDIAPATLDKLIGRLADAGRFIDGLLRTAREGQLLRRGIRAAIVGPPNAGKSSLLNQLLGHSRAIVSPIEGTTRDTIEETANIRGLPIVFIDTAGLRASTDLIEREGIRRSEETLAQAELILRVVDLTQPADASESEWSQRLSGRAHIVVGNKSDLPAQRESLETTSTTVAVSCTTGAGIEALKDAIAQKVWGGALKPEMLQATINARHQNALSRAREGLERCVEILREAQALELAAMELRIATAAVGEVVGKTSTEDLLDSIFSQFCIGK